jgi:GTP-binding protein
MTRSFNCQYLTSAVKPSHFLTADLPEIALSGRSNVGKSSLLNMLMGRSGVAKVSKTPGKTRAINFFDVGGKWRLVDLPGYGFARLSKDEIERWGVLVDTYLRERETLTAVIQLIDSRHPPMQSDLDMIGWLAETGISTVIALTKVDKLGKNEARQVDQKFHKTYLQGLNWPVVATSAETKSGREDLLNEIDRLLAKAELPPNS